jgi:hypothetical protein
MERGTAALASSVESMSQARSMRHALSGNFQDFVHRVRCMRARAVTSMMLVLASAP